MKIEDALKQLKPGGYVLAISGGVDSMALLSLVAGAGFGSGHEFIVAHVNHGIRPDNESNSDESLVGAIANEYGFEYISTRLGLGPGTSEDRAREKRHQFLGELMQERGFDKIITAHHKDDVIETMVMNLIRGTGRKGLSSLKNTSKFERPLLEFEKSQIIDYAKSKELEWGEDSTNQDETYFRNYVRARIMPRLGSSKGEFFSIYKQMLELNHEIDAELSELVDVLGGRNEFERSKFIMLPIEVSYSFLHYLLSELHGVEVNYQLMRNARTFIHTAKDNKKLHINKKIEIKINKSKVIVGAR